LDFAHLPLSLVGFLHWPRSSAMNLSVSAFPDPPKNIDESRDPDLCEDPVNEEHDRQIGDDEIVPQDDAEVQIMRHKSSFFRGSNSWKDFHELNQEVI
jgi:hypothetical protein